MGHRARAKLIQFSSRGGIEPPIFPVKAGHPRWFHETTRPTGTSSHGIHENKIDYIFILIFFFCNMLSNVFILLLNINSNDSRPNLLLYYLNVLSLQEHK